MLLQNLLFQAETECRQRQEECDGYRSLVAESQVAIWLAAADVVVQPLLVMLLLLLQPFPLVLLVLLCGVQCCGGLVAMVVWCIGRVNSINSGVTAAATAMCCDYDCLWFRRISSSGVQGYNSGVVQGYNRCCAGV